MLYHYLWTLLTCFGDRDMPVQVECSGRIVDCNQSLPLLHGEWCAVRNSQSDLFTLRVERVVIDECYTSERTIYRGVREGLEVLIRES